MLYINAFLQLFATASHAIALHIIYRFIWIVDGSTLYSTRVGMYDNNNDDTNVGKALSPQTST